MNSETNFQMKINAILLFGTLLVWGGISCEQAEAATFFINSPAGFSGQRTTIDFEGFPDLTVADNLYQNQGITFSRDDGNNVVLSDFAALGRSTSSGSNTLATIGTAQNNYTWVTSLNVHPVTPLYEIGAYFGNDQTLFGPTDFTTERLSVYNSIGALLGSVTVAANQNTNVDQFIGIGSDTPITSVRFENLSSSGSPSVFFSVIIDDLTFVQVPEPGSVLQVGCGLIVWLLPFKIRRKALKNLGRPNDAA